jgi:hypothetical protein
MSRNGKQLKAQNPRSNKYVELRVHISTFLSGSSPKPYVKCVSRVQERKLQSFHETLLSRINLVLAGESDAGLKRAWMKKHGQYLDAAWARKFIEINHEPNISEESAILSKNVVSFYQSLPKGSVIRTCVVNQLFDNIPAASISKSLDISIRRVSKARNTNSKPLSYYMSHLELPRNRLGPKEVHVLNWIMMYCIVPSGKSARCFYGTFAGMYSEYHAWTVRCEFPSVSPTTFNQLRKRERVWLLKGDIFVDKGIIRMREITREVNMLQKAAPVDHQQIARLQVFFSFVFSFTLIRVFHHPFNYSLILFFFYFFSFSDLIFFFHCFRMK